MTVAEAQKSGGVGKYLAIYICLLVIAGLQFVVAYSNLDPSQMLLRMLSLAILEAGLAAMFFMHLWSEKRGFLLFIAIFVIFVMAAMQYSWPDSFRMFGGAPYSQTKAAP